MTLKEAIAHAREKALNGTGECAREHAQLARWLTALDNYREGMKARPVEFPRKVGKTVKTGKCPRCGWLIGTPDAPNYCGHCGQAVMWE